MPSTSQEQKVAKMTLRTSLGASLEPPDNMHCIKCERCITRKQYERLMELGKETHSHLAEAHYRLEEIWQTFENEFPLHVDRLLGRLEVVMMDMDIPAKDLMLAEVESLCIIDDNPEEHYVCPACDDGDI